MKADQLAGLSLEFLLQVLGEAYESGLQNPDVESAFVYRHARNVSELGRDVALLYSHQQYTAASVAIRSMLESMFCVVASVKTKGFAVEKLIAESEDMSSRITKNMNVENNPDLIEAVAGYDGLAAKLRKEHGITSKNKWNVYQVAKAADLQDMYLSSYFIHCGYVHCTAAGMVSQEHGLPSTHSLHAAIGSMVVTAGFLAQQIQTLSPQTHVDRSADLLGLLTEIISGEESRSAAEERVDLSV